MIIIFVVLNFMFLFNKKPGTVLNTIYLTGTELAHQARAAVVRGIS
jgi:hypothetical protein